MELKCFLLPGWEPRIRPASSQRAWMDQAPESFPYRCLPLSMANSHGWELLSPSGFEVEWNGGMAPEDVVIRADPGARPHELPQPLFGQASFTIHVQGLFPTPPGWNLWVGGPPNAAKDGVAPLAGIIETDWSPYSFTMNWQMTRARHIVRFEENEPFAFIFPVPRGAAEGMEPRFVAIDEDPELNAGFAAWSRSRDAFQQHVRDHPPSKPADKWQKYYYRGLMPDGKCPFPDHQSKLQVKPFGNAELAGNARQAMARPVVARPPAIVADVADPALAKRDWLLTTLQQQRALSPAASGIFRREGLSATEFLDSYYAPGRPVVIAGEIDDWPARTKWTSEYLRRQIGDREVEYQDERTSHADFERYKDNHTRRGRFDHFLDRITRQDGNSAYLTAYNASPNAAALVPLDADIGRLDKFLDQSNGSHGGLMWMGPAGTFTPLHHDLTNNLVVQVAGRKRVVLAAATDTANLYNDHHGFSRIRDLTDPAIDLAAFPKLAEITCYDVVLQPGEILYIPIGWWHQVEALDFSISLTFTNFRWRNDWYQGFPG